LRDPDVVCLQHEYGIFGGQRGGFIVELVQDLKIPLITTLHTVLKDPSPQERQILVQLSEVSHKLVVMSERGAQFLRDVYHVPESKIGLIHHGILDVPFLESDPCKSKIVADDKIIILTFGLLSPGKGIEYMVDALPDIVRLHPEVLYFVVGATHPHMGAESGEDYRLSLHLRAKELGVADHIVFHGRFLERDELLEFIRAAEIYVTSPARWPTPWGRARQSYRLPIGMHRKCWPMIGESWSLSGITRLWHARSTIFWTTLRNASRCGERPISTVGRW
jgi:glycosyltransferase involved in cell wall biosynthesis